MRKFCLAVLALVLCGLTACGSATSSTESRGDRAYRMAGLESHSAQPKAKQHTSAAVKNVAFVATVHKILPASKQLSNSYVVKLGHTVCKALGLVHSKTDLVVFASNFAESAAKSSGGAMSEKDGYHLLGAAIGAYCPRVERYLS